MINFHVTLLSVSYPESAKLRGLRGNMVTWVCGLRGSVGPWVEWVIIFTWVAWVKYIFVWVQIFLRGSLRGSTFIY